MHGWPRILVVFAFPVVAAAWVIYSQFDLTAATRLTREGKLVQDTQVACLIGAAILGLRSVVRCWRVRQRRLIRNGFMVLVGLLILLALEETNWGQDGLEYESPEWIRAISGQGSAPVSLHNLAVFQPYRHWLIILFGAVGISLILLAGVFARRGMNRNLLFFVPPRVFCITLLIILFGGVFREVAGIRSKHGISFTQYRSWAGRFTEIAELGVAVTALAYMGAKGRRLAREAAEGSEIVDGVPDQRP